jgi:multicomponent Na+:H+ antiporter subunit D
VLEPAWFAEPAPRAVPGGEAPPLVLAMVWLAALLNLYFGLVPAFPVGLAETAASGLLSHLE